MLHRRASSPAPSVTGLSLALALGHASALDRIHHITHLREERPVLAGWDEAVAPIGLKSWAR